ncbi:MAG: permease, partial [Rhodospirillales bacterium]|nr:permease [Rhodospirillales bacterium]
MTDIALKVRDLAGHARRLDRAWMAVAIIFVLLTALVPEQAAESTRFALEAVLGILPFLALAVGIAAYARATGADGLIAYAFQGNLPLMIAFAALFGGLSPFCSCGVIPLIAALLAMGVPLPAPSNAAMLSP